MNGIPADSILPYPKEGQEDGWDKIDHELLSMLDHVLLTYKGDPGRVYLTGLSTGGFGVVYRSHVSRTIRCHSANQCIRTS